MKVWELINALSRLPACDDVFVSIECDGVRVAVQEADDEEVENGIVLIGDGQYEDEEE